jgi:subtilisin family serine protease
LQSLAAQNYLSQLRSEQATFVQAMRSIMPSASVSTFRNENGLNEAASYQIVFNGMSVDPGQTNRDQARKALLALPNVKNVYLDFAHATTLYTSTALINAPALWNNTTIGGRANAGAGIKFASVDGGVHKDAPMFSGVGYTYPPDFPAGGKGLKSNNNGKIIASRAYFRSWDPPAPGDENPWPGVNGTSHGVHTSGIAAGNIVNADFQGVQVPNISGVAPKAWVMSYRVFYASVNGNESFFTTEGIAALEDVVADGADVVNNSWGEGPTAVGGEFDALDQVLLNTNAAGVFVSMSAGNSGPGGATTDHPSNDYIIAAATTTSGTFASGRVSVTAPTTPISPTLQNRAFGTADFGSQLAPGLVANYLFKPAAAVDPANVIGCTPFPANAFQGVAAVIERGTCDFSLKVFNAQQAGATFAVIHNHAVGGEAVQGMGAGANAEQVTISSIFVPRSMGLDMVNWYATNGGTSGLSVSTVAFQAGNVPDVVIGFSSRGPGVGNVLKPDIAAPGVNILSQGYTPGATGEARHLGFGQVSGTSMASPHVAGAAALLRQLHPNWSNAYIKSALMSTSKYTDIYVDQAQTIPAQPLDIGAGRLDLTNAADPGVILDPPSLSYGLISNGANKSIQVTLTSVASAAETYNITTLFTGNSFTQTTTLPGFSVEPASVTLAPGEKKTITVTFNSATGQGVGENQGYIILDGPTHDAHMPAWARVTYAQNLADVLIIDNDSSALDPAFGVPPAINYVDTYTRTLTTLGYSYDIWDADAHAADASLVPDPTTLFAYDAVIYFTGDNFTQVLSVQDMDRLIEYANNGGFLLAMGQDLAASLGAAQTVAQANAGSSVFLYNLVLGANWLQDSVTNNAAPTLPIVSSEEAPQVFKDIFLNLNNSNQLYIDEIRPTPPATDIGDPNMPEELEPFVGLLRYPGPNNVEDGIVAVAHRDQPSLEAPGVAYLGRTIYTSFGLEGVNNVAGATSREELLQTFLEWAKDTSTATISQTMVITNSQLVVFEATVTSPISGTTGLTYRWDFGDGSAIVGPFSTSQASHSYAICGVYRVRVETTDSYGNRTIGESRARVQAGCAGRQLLPVLRR